jgi:hypothetical protein
MIFSRNDHLSTLIERDAQFKSILELGSVKEICIDFLTEFCHHPAHSYHIFWHKIPFIEIECLSTQSIINIANNSKGNLFHLISPIMQNQNVRYASFLCDFKLPSWKLNQEFIAVLNSSGGLSLIPTKQSLTSTELLKIKRLWKTRVKKVLDQMREDELLDIIAPKIFPNSEYHIQIEEKSFIPEEHPECLI